MFVQWKVCGRIVAPTTDSEVQTLSSNKTGNLRSRVASPVSLHPVGRHARMLKKSTTSSGSSNNNNNYNEGSIISYGADGYPCGLWFLFHYLSGRFQFHNVQFFDIYYISDCLICASCQIILFLCSLFFFFSCLQWPAPIPGMAFSTLQRRCCAVSTTLPNISLPATIAGAFLFVRNFSEYDVYVFTHPGHQHKITGNISCAPMTTAHLIGATLAKRITILCR